jgi:hypothetical protein
MMMKLKTAISVICLFLSGCATTTINTYKAAGENVICDVQGSNLGIVAVLPETAWRADQKEPEKRKIMALEEIKRSFREMPCGNMVAPGGVREFYNWSNQPESELIKRFSEEGVDTIILVRIEELTPRLYFTFSIPFLWVGTNEADFRIRALSVNSGAVLLDMRVKRSTGGPFNIRPADWSAHELSAALEKVIRGE